MKFLVSRCACGEIIAASVYRGGNSDADDEFRQEHFSVETIEADGLALGECRCAELIDQRQTRAGLAEARVAELENLIAEAVCYDWDAECPPKELRERISKALSGRKED